MKPWLNIVGIGQDGLSGLSEVVKVLLGKADVIFGSTRLHQLTSTLNVSRVHWPKPFDLIYEQIASYRGKIVVVLVTGDPLWFSGYECGSWKTFVVAMFDVFVIGVQAMVGSSMCWRVQPALTVKQRASKPCGGTRPSGSPSAHACKQTYLSTLISRVRAVRSLHSPRGHQDSD